MTQKFCIVEHKRHKHKQHTQTQCTIFVIGVKKDKHR